MKWVWLLAWQHIPNGAPVHPDTTFHCYVQCSVFTVHCVNMYACTDVRAYIYEGKSVLVSVHTYGMFLYLQYSGFVCVCVCLCVCVCVFVCVCVCVCVSLSLGGAFYPLSWLFEQLMPL